MSAALQGPGPLHVAPNVTDGRLFSIVSNHQSRKGEWDDIYVEFSGYFGSYGPHMFAAAPELLEMLQLMVRWHDQLSPADVARAKAVIAKAEGGAA